MEKSAFQVPAQTFPKVDTVAVVGLGSLVTLHVIGGGLGTTLLLASVTTATRNCCWPGVSERKSLPATSVTMMWAGGPAFEPPLHAVNPILRTTKTAISAGK